MLKTAFWGLSVLAVGLVVSLYLGTVGLEDEGRPDQAAEQTKAVSKAAPRQKPLAEYGNLMRSTRFRSRSGAEGLPRPKPSAVLPTLSGFRLVGLADGPARLSSAVIEDTNRGRQEIVGLGERIGPGVLVDVLADRVVIRVGERHHQLTLPREFPEKTRPKNATELKKRLLQNRPGTGSRVQVPGSRPKPGPRGRKNTSPGE